MGTSAILVAADIDTLRREACRTHVVIEFAHQIGDFIAVGAPLMLLHGGAATAEDRILRGAVVFGPERTIEQDGTFAFG